MSVQAVSWVLDHSASKANDRCVLIALANRFDPKEPHRCWPGIETLAREANVSGRTVTRCIDSLVTLGELLVYHGQGGNTKRRNHRTNLYVLPALTEWRPDDLTTCHPDIGVDLTDRAFRPDKPGEVDLTLVSRDTTEDVDRDPSASRAPALVGAFDAFWRQYPRKVGKRKAEAAFIAALKRATSEALVAGAIRYAHDPNRDPGYTAHPTTWLNRDGWLDEPEPVRTNGRRVSQARSAVAEAARSRGLDPEQIRADATAAHQRAHSGLKSDVIDTTGRG
jgi:hypothetical protein